MVHKHIPSYKFKLINADISRIHKYLSVRTISPLFKFHK